MSVFVLRPVLRSRSRQASFSPSERPLEADPIREELVCVCFARSSAARLIIRGASREDFVAPRRLFTTAPLSALEGNEKTEKNDIDWALFHDF
jgi:hypothetical protein